MKKLVLLLLMTNCYANEFYKFYDAIQQIDIVEFKKLLNTQGPLTAEQKMKLLKETEEVINKTKNKLVFFKSEKDILRTLVGYVIAIFPLAVISTEDFKRYEEWEKKIAYFIGLPICVFGALEIYKGMMLESAYTNLNNARQIQELIEDAPLKIKFGQP